MNGPYDNNEAIQSKDDNSRRQQQQQYYRDGSLVAPEAEEGSMRVSDLESAESKDDDEDGIDASFLRSYDDVQQRSRLQSYDDVQRARADMDAPPGSVSYMMGLFAPPQSSFSAASAADGTHAESNTTRPPLPPLPPSTPHSNYNNSTTDQESTPLLSHSTWDQTNSSMTATPKIRGKGGQHTTYNSNDFSSSPQRPHVISRRSTSGGGAAHHSRLSSVPFMPSINELPNSPNNTNGSDNHNNSNNSKKFSTSATLSKIKSTAKIVVKDTLNPTTAIGSFMFLLMHVVFCLAIGSAIIRPHGQTSILGLMTKTAALGIIFTSPVYWTCLSSEIPALYPTVDLFLAPFLANLASIVDETLFEDTNITKAENIDTIFLATLGVLAGIGTSFAAGLLLLANVFKLANMGSYLPFPVICGFFAAVGILTWTLAISVDCGGKSIQKIIGSGDPELWMFAIIHHIPTIAVASVMKYLGPKNPFSVVLVILATILIFHVGMFFAGISLEEAKEMGWFWSHDELVYKSDSTLIGFETWAPPAPFAILHEVFVGNVHWGAVSRGMKTSLALGFLYMIRCSVHGTALKKNIPNLSRKARHDDPDHDEAAALLPETKASSSGMAMKNASRRKFSEAVDIVVVMQQSKSAGGDGGGSNATRAGGDGKAVKMYHAKPSNISLKEIMAPYAYSQLLASIVGGFAITPSVAASPTMFMLGADKVAPQVGAVLGLLVFYLTDFQLVGYIPKPAFSSMLVLAFIDMTYTWFYKSYFKTQNKLEWLVVPLIVVCAFAVDLLSSVFLGIAFSTFIFVTSIFRSGVVKYVADGVVVRSTIERPLRNSVWLDKNGDRIQIMVLQNYLFFGNATSVYNFIGTEFFDSTRNDDVEHDEQQQHGKPKFLILDLSLVTGMDTSTVGVFNDIRNLCKSNSCKLFMSGMSPSIRSLLSLGDFKADTGVRSQRKLRFFSNLDTSVGKAEDMLLQSDFEEKVAPETDPRRRRLMSEGDYGFRTALRYIDEEHGDGFSMDLLPLQEFISLVELNEGDKLYEKHLQSPLERGLFFIECGVLKIERDAANTMTRGTLRGSSHGSIFGPNDDSLTKIQARSLSRISSVLSQDASAGNMSFRLARIGPGWIAGTSEAVCGIEPTGDYVAVTHCRLHHLPFEKLEEIEKKNPAVVLRLYKLLAYLMGRRQEATIGQLATLHSIMSSPAHHSKTG